MRPPELIEGAALGLPGRKFLLQALEGREGAYFLLEIQEPAASGRARATQALLAAVTRVTGYETQRLRGELRWEADLGVDRVKRLRIAEALALSRPVSRVQREALEREETLGGWIAVLSSGEPGSEEPALAGDRETEQAVAGESAELPVTEERVTELLLRVVEEKTGYSRETLDLDADLEADLGIDTIKQAQILGQIRKHYPLRFQDGLRIKDFPTLRHWIRFTLAQASGQKFVAAPKPADASPAELERLEVVLEELAAPAAPEAPLEGAVLITDDGLGVARALETLLAESSVPCALLPAEVLDSTESALAAVRSAAERLGPIRALAHLYPIGRREDSRAEDERCVTSLLTLAKTLRPTLKRLLAATGAGGGFGFDDRDALLRASDGGVAGFVKTAAAEWPEVPGRVIDLDAESVVHDPAASAQALWRELRAPSGAIEVGIRGERRVTPRALRRELDLSRPAELELDSGSVILISGGGLGIGAEIALDLARRHRCALAILGRTERQAAGAPGADVGMPGTVAASVQLERNLAEIERAGSSVLYLRCDVGDPAEVERACGEARARFGSIHGVIHAAGILEDGEIEEKTEESFRRVYRVKVEGLRQLIRHAVRGGETRFVTAFSSVAGRFGNPRQCDYAAANEAMSRICRRLAREMPELRSFAVAWGAWDQVGMAARSGVAEVLKAAGEAAIAPAEGAAALRAELLCGDRAAERVIRAARPEGGAEPAEGAPSGDAFCLLGKFLRYRRGHALVSERVLHAERDRWLKDHTLLENPVMPGTMGVEMMVQAALALYPGFRFARLKGLRIESGIQLIGQDELAIQVKARAEVGAGGLEREARVSIEAGEGRICYSATVVLAREGCAAGQGARETARAELDAEGDAVDPSYIYERIRLGPAFQILSEYRKSASGGGWGRVGSRGVRDFLPEWPEEKVAPRFHALPIPLEAAFHSVALVRLLDSGAVLIPRGIGEYVVHRETEAEQGLLLRAIPKGPTLFDILICAPDGEVRAEVRDFETLDVTEISTWKQAPVEGNA